MTIYSGFFHWKWWFSHSYVSLPEGSSPSATVPLSMLPRGTSASEVQAVGWTLGRGWWLEEVYQGEMIPRGAGKKSQMVWENQWPHGDLKFRWRNEVFDPFLWNPNRFYHGSFEWQLILEEIDEILKQGPGMNRCSTNLGFLEGCLMKGALSDNMGQGLRSDPNLGTQVYHYCIYIYIYTRTETNQTKDGACDVWWVNGHTTKMRSSEEAIAFGSLT